MLKKKAMIWSAIAILLTACDEKKADLQQYVDKVRQSQVINIAPLPIMVEYEQFHYGGEAYRDPFLSEGDLLAQKKKIEQQKTSILPNISRNKEALELYDISELSFVGTLEKEGLWALIKTSDGVINRIQVGNYIGRNHGKVTTIDQQMILLEEIIMDSEGVYRQHETTLSIVSGE